MKTNPKLLDEFARLSDELAKLIQDEADAVCGEDDAEIAHAASARSSCSLRRESVAAQIEMMMKGERSNRA